MRNQLEKIKILISIERLYESYFSHRKNYHSNAVAEFFNYVRLTNQTKEIAQQYAVSK